MDHAIERIGGVFKKSIDNSTVISVRCSSGHAKSISRPRAPPDRSPLHSHAISSSARSLTISGRSGVVNDYADVLGEQGLAEYRRLATAAWEKLHGGRRRKDASDNLGSVAQLTAILDFFAERDGDVETRIALRAESLSSQWAYLQLRICLSQGRGEEALKRAEEGLWRLGRWAGRAAAAYGQAPGQTRPQG